MVMLLVYPSCLLIVIVQMFTDFVDECRAQKLADGLAKPMDSAMRAPMDMVEPARIAATA